MGGEDFIYRPRVVKWMLRMQGWKNGEGRLRLFQREAHGLCSFGTNRAAIVVTRRMSVRGWDKGWSEGVMRVVACVRGM